MNDHIQDVVMGACVGDAVGATLEFLKGRPPKDLVKDALAMKGGGFLDLAPGQITDDGELTICLARALVRNKDPMSYYKKWLTTNPIDVGIATKQAITTGRLNTTTEANGALMRCSPIAAFYCQSRSYEEIAELAREEARRTHASLVCQECNAVYCVAIAHLLQNRNAKAAIEEARRHTKHPKVVTWLNESSAPNVDLTEHTGENIGWVRWGFTLAFHHLYHLSSYKDAIISVVSRGGDTDTNAAIVGAMMAALWGHRAIPSKWMDTVCACEARPSWLRPIQFT